MSEQFRGESITLLKDNKQMGKIDIWCQNWARTLSVMSEDIREKIVKNMFAGLEMTQMIQVWFSLVVAVESSIQISS